MEEFGKFLANYWQLIVSVILMIISTIIALIRRKPITSVTSEIYDLVVKAISSVEVEGIIGSIQKLDVATSKVVEALQTIYPKANCKIYIPYIHKVIEDVLSTPTKKGGIGRG